jgi:hypothetical protein
LTALEGRAPTRRWQNRDPVDPIAIAKLLNLTPAKVTGYLNAYYKRTDSEFRLRRNKIRREKRETIIDRSLHTDLLTCFYPDSMLSALGVSRYRFRLDSKSFTLNLFMTDEAASMKVPLDLDRAQFTILKEDSYPAFEGVSEEETVRTLQDFLDDGRRVFNQPLYRLLRFKTRANKLLMDFGLTDFVRYVTTCGTLENELFQALIDSDLSPHEAFSNKDRLMPQRHRFLPSGPSLIKLDERLCAGGLAVLFAFVRPRPHNDFVFFVKRRSAKVALGHGLLSLVPMGYHQPCSVSSAFAEKSLRSTVFREALEEIFGRDEVISDDAHLVADWFMAEPELQWFRDNPGHFVLEAVGLAWNLLLGDYTAAILMAVMDLSYWNKFSSKFVTNYEHETSENFLVSTKDDAGIARLLSDPKFVDPGRFTLIRALKRLKQIEPTRVKLPPIAESI